ncbi:MAG: transposase, partial [Deltaproteobacteria bacterium]|nr:transposase [Deltaproteobacteria bacterium]
MAFPEWVEKQKRRGHEIKRVGDNYYLYGRKSKWDPVKKKAKKKTGEYLGAITPSGFVAKRTTPPEIDTVSVKEYGATAYLGSISSDIFEVMTQEFPDRIGEMLYALAILRAKGEESFKRMDIQYLTSYLSETIPGLAMSGASIASLLETVGRKREQIVAAMNRLSRSAKNIIIDGTRLTSWSKGMSLADLGHDSSGRWDPQVNIIYVFERALSPRPVFYRRVRGNIPDVSAMRLTMESMGSDCVFTVVADAGFASAENFGMLVDGDIKYIVPLKRNTSEIVPADLNARDNYRHAFTYAARPVMAYEPEKDGYRIVVFRDEFMRSREMSDFIKRLEKKNQAIRESKKKEKAPESDIEEEAIKSDPYFGTIIVRTNLDDSPQEIYETYKMRVAIEQCFDTLKNTLSQDHGYMHSDESFEAWCFINHIALTLAYRVLNTLKDKNLAA